MLDGKNEQQNWYLENSSSRSSCVSVESFDVVLSTVWSNMAGQFHLEVARMPRFIVVEVPGK